MNNSISKIAKKKNILFLFLTFFASSIYSSAQTITGSLVAPTICCENSIISFTANCQGANDLIYRFLVDGTEVQPYSPSPVYTRVMTTTGTYEVTVEVSLESNSAISEPFSMTIEVVGKPAAEAEFYEITTCQDSILLKAKTPLHGTGKWYLAPVGGMGILTQISPTEAIVRDLGNGINQFRWEVSSQYCGGAPRDTIVKVTSNNPKGYANAGSNLTVLKPDVRMNASYLPTGVTGKWSVIGGTGVFDDPSDNTSMVRNLSHGFNTFRWTVTENGCTAYGEVTVFFVKEPIADISADITQGCVPLTVTFTNKTIGSAQFFIWNFGDESPNDTIFDGHPYTHTFETGKKYEVELIAVGEFKRDTAKISIEVMNFPEISFALKDTVFSPNEEIRFVNRTTGASLYEWDFGDGTTSDNPNPVHSYTQEGIYEVNLSASNGMGCETDSSMYVSITYHFIVFPSAFIPNVASSNGGTYTLYFNGTDSQRTDVFYPVWRGVDKSRAYNFQIFNRWGQLIFRTEDIDRGWDGYVDGKIAPQDTYIYRATGVFSNGKGFNKTGEITLLQ